MLVTVLGGLFMMAGIVLDWNGFRYLDHHGEGRYLPACQDDPNTWWYA
jgi:hypothetical protein